MLLSPSRLPRIFGALVLVVTIISCGGDSTTPTAPSWANGTWVAVRANGKPLPFRLESTYPYIQDDSLVVFIFDPPIDTLAGAVFPSSTLFFSPTSAPSPILCYDGSVAVTVSPTGLSTRAKGATTSGGNCNTSSVNFDFTRKGDSLVTTWDGADIRLVRR